MREELDNNACGSAGGPALRRRIKPIAGVPGTTPTESDSSATEQHASASATSGTGKCVGDYEGIATLTPGANGNKVWDLSGCKPVQ